MKKKEGNTRVLFGSMHYEWPYSLSPKQIEKVKRLNEKYRDKAHNYAKKHNLSGGLTCYKKSGYPNVSIVVCYLSCFPVMGGCADFRRGFHFCNTLKCPYVEDCFSRGTAFRKEKCKKMNLTKERVKVKKRYEKFVLFYKIARGFKLDPLKTIKFLKSKKKKENGKIQAIKNKEKVGKGRKKQKKKHKKGTPVKKTNTVNKKKVHR